MPPWKMSSHLHDASRMWEDENVIPGGSKADTGHWQILVMIVFSSIDLGTF